MQKIILFTLIAVLSASVFAGGPGTTGVNYLRIGMGARAVAMGEAQVAITDSVDAMYWNPAGLALVKRYEVGLMHLAYWQGISYESAAFVLPMKDIGVFAIGGTYINSGSIDKTIETTSGSNYLLAGTTFSYSAFSATVSYANNFLIEKQPVFLGASLKAVSDSIDGTSAIALGVDAGMMYLLAKNLLVGMSVTNLGTVFGENAMMPLTVKAGAGYKFGVAEGHSVIVALDGVLPVDAGLKANFGVEYGINKVFFLRSGYKLNYDLESISAGAGFRTSFGGAAYELDYAFVPGKDDIGSTHRISLIVRFGYPLLKPGEEFRD
ncbi:MAG: PorV/PorQ family protein [Candidatus Firestonebacteria bacterium]